MPEPNHRSVAAAMLNYAAARVNMVDGQIRPNRVNDPAIVDAFNNVPRELFVPDDAQEIAYVDEMIQVGRRGRRLLEPMVLARMLQAAEITPRDVVLDIGCATGYSTAVIAHLACSVVAVESDEELVEHAGKALVTLAADAAKLVKGPLSAGYPALAPYDVIIINGMVAEVPQAILSQLADGGRLLTISPFNHDIVKLGRVKLYRRLGNNFSSVCVFEAAAAKLPGFEVQPRFVF